MIHENTFKKAFEAISEVHSTDINKELHDGTHYPSELLYSQRMYKTLIDYDPSANYAMQLAALCQHFERWEIQRDTFPMNKKGYYDWRKAVMTYQLKRTVEVLKASGLEDVDIEEVTDILLNRGKKDHDKGQVLEDVACIVFVEWYLEPFSEKHDLTKVIDIVTKTVKKISSKGMFTISEKELPEVVGNILKQL
jgi:hypothetical protein